jgi:hypothetical protein
MVVMGIISMVQVKEWEQKQLQYEPFCKTLKQPKQVKFLLWTTNFFGRKVEEYDFLEGSTELHDAANIVMWNMQVGQITRLWLPWGMCLSQALELVSSLWEVVDSTPYQIERYNVQLPMQLS